MNNTFYLVADRLKLLPDHLGVFLTHNLVDHFRLEYLNKKSAIFHQ